MALKFAFSNLYLFESTVSCDIKSGESVRTLLFELVVTSHDPVPPACGNTPWRNCPSPSTAHQESWRFLLQGMPCQRRHYATKQHLRQPHHHHSVFDPYLTRVLQVDVSSLLQNTQGKFYLWSEWIESLRPDTKKTTNENTAIDSSVLPQASFW